MALLQWTLIWKRNTIIPCGHFHRHIGLHASPQTFLSAILQSWCIQTIDQPAKPTELPMSWNMCLLSNHFSHQTKWLSSCMAQSTAIWGTSLHPSLTSTSLDSIPFFICSVCYILCTVIIGQPTNLRLFPPLQLVIGTPVEPYKWDEAEFLVQQAWVKWGSVPLCAAYVHILHLNQHNLRAFASVLRWIAAWLPWLWEIFSISWIQWILILQL